MDEVKDMGKIIGIHRSSITPEFLSCVPIEYINREGINGHIINPQKIWDNYTEDEIVEMTADNPVYLNELIRLSNIQESNKAFGILLLNY